MSGENEFKSKIYCAKCGEVPFIYLASTNPLELQMECVKCGKKWRKDYKDLKSESLEEKGAQPSENCSKHKDTKQEFYCQKCRVNFCSRCKTDHEKCFGVIDLSSFPSKDTFTKKINQAKLKFIEGYKALKEICIKRLKAEIERVEEIFEEKKEVNLKLIEYIQILEFNYNKNNYQSLFNLLQNTNFNSILINPNQTYQWILDQVKPYYIINTNLPKPKTMTEMTCVQTLNEHSKPIYCLCLVDETRFASCSQDSTIKIFDSETYQCLYTLEGNSTGVVYIEMLGRNRLLSCRKDRIIVIWELLKDQGKILHQILTHHTHYLTKAIQLSKERIASCSYDDTIEIFDANYQSLKILKVYGKGVKSIIELKNKNLIVSAGTNDTIRFWNTLTYGCETVSTDIPCGGNKCMIELDKGILVVCGKDKISVIDLNNFQIKSRITHTGLKWIDTVSEIEADTLLCGCLIEGDWSFIRVDVKGSKILDVKTKVHEWTITGLLVMNENTFISCSYDKYIKIWK